MLGFVYNLYLLVDTEMIIGIVRGYGVAAWICREVLSHLQPLWVSFSPTGHERSSLEGSLKHWCVFQALVIKRRQPAAP